MLKVFVLFLVCNSVISYSIPSYVHLCKRNDSNFSRCIINTVNEIKPYLKKGIPEMNLPPIDPFHIDNVTLSDNGQGAIVDFNIYNGTIANTSNFQISQLNIDLDNKKCTVKNFFPSLQLTSQYSLKGKLMVFNLDGTGNLKFVMSNVTTYTEWYGTNYTKDGKQYLKFDKGNLTSQVGGIVMRIDDLFKNNQALTDNFNQIINKNADILTKEFSPILDKTINMLAMQYFNYVFNVFPIDVLFPRA